MLWFTADTHFGHTNIIHYCGRPFISKEEHDESIISNWNSLIEKGDTIYHLGDFGFGDPQYLRKICARLKGRIHFIVGNHDKKSTLDVIGDRFSTIRDVNFMKVKINGRSQLVFLSHYAHRTWQRSNHGSWHLFGHSHNNLESYGLSFDVGVDCWNFEPISIERVEKKMNTLQQKMDYDPKVSKHKYSFSMEYTHNQD